MTPERLHRIRAVYEAAADTPAAGRQALLERECEGDDELRQEVDRLLSARERVPEWLSGPLLDAANAAVDMHSTLTHPARRGHVHFPPGTVLAQRYRIVHLLGRGGMGEVYRADDVFLGQPVALKFLPPATTANASALNRFRNEVRTARQVSHPHVCRVYDIGEAEGLTYLSMEYVDGEDLASLLRRIGKLPQDKALEITRQLCAGLAAAHDKGVIHRDLKPANIMLDGKGHIRITDFGIAGMAEQIRDVRSGTPAYMSPEQLAGKEVTSRSDIYALGIVLCELLTGKRPPLTPGEPGGTELDPAVERVIRRCLEPDPKLRPASALAVSAALPGGDPLAAALARGETPAPELVANAGSVEGLRPWVAVACLAVVIVGLGLLCVLRQRHDFINQIPMENSSEVLAAKAREIAKSFGYTDRPVDTVFAWQYDTDYFRYAREQENPSDRDARLYAPYPPAVYFWYRQSPNYPINSDLDYEAYSFNRDTLEPGMQAVVLDSEGRLLEFHARPPVETHAGNEVPAFEWSRLFAAAGLDSARFTAVHPELTPTAAFDAQAAWTGSAEGNENLRVEAAAFQGRPVSFRVIGPWVRLNQPPAFSFGTLPPPIFILFVLALPAAAGLLAWRNVRSGRGDRSGALRLAGFLFLFTLLDNLAGMHHVPTLAELALLFAAMRYAVTLGALGWLLYIAFEPQVRKRAPASLISWNRLLAARFPDPMVGGHLLVGVALGVLTYSAVTSLTPRPIVETFAPLLPWSNGGLLSLWFYLAIGAIAGGLGVSLVLNLISIVVQRKWLAAVIFVLVLTLVLVPTYGRPSFTTTARLAILHAVLAYTLVRFGVLAAVAQLYTEFAILDFPLTTNWSAWYAEAALLGIATLVGLALYGFVTTLTGRQLRPNKLEAT
jgi:serine/threonine protein kinase